MSLRKMWREEPSPQPRHTQACQPWPRGRWTGVVVGLGLSVSVGCQGPQALLDLTSLDPSQDHWKIASVYTHEAAAMRQKAEELSNRAAHYEQLFGPTSDWVTGTRLLAQFYEETARERDRLAGLHVGLAGGRPSAPPPGLGSR